MHGGAHPIPVAEIVVVAHAELVTVIKHRRSRHRQQHGVKQLDLAPVVVEQRRQPTANAEIEAGPAVGGVGAPQIVTLVVGHHFERELVVVAQEQRPLALLRDVRCLTENIGDRVTIFLRKPHVHARHQGEMERHVAFVVIAEIDARVFWPLVGFRQQHTIGIFIDLFSDLLQNRMRLGQVFVIGPFALAKIRHRVEPQAVDAEVEPITHDFGDFLDHLRIFEIEIGLVRIEAVPVIGIGDRVPRPIRLLRVDKNNAGFGVALVAVAPHVEGALRRTFGRSPRRFEPGMLVRCVIDHELGEHAEVPAVGLL